LLADGVEEPLRPPVHVDIRRIGRLYRDQKGGYDTFQHPEELLTVELERSFYLRNWIRASRSGRDRLRAAMRLVWGSQA